VERVGEHEIIAYFGEASRGNSRRHSGGVAAAVRGWPVLSAPRRRRTACCSPLPAGGRCCQQHRPDQQCH
jgi:hypothetical protein